MSFGAMLETSVSICPFDVVVFLCTRRLDVARSPACPGGITCLLTDQVYLFGSDLVCPFEGCGKSPQACSG